MVRCPPAAPHHPSGPARPVAYGRPGRRRAAPRDAPRTGPGPTAPDVNLKATLDELTARVQQMSQRADATAELAETLMGATQRLAHFEEAIAAEAAAVRQLLA
jgi:hypothetical protein